MKFSYMKKFSIWLHFWRKLYSCKIDILILCTNNRTSYFIEITEKTMPKHQCDSDNTLQVINLPRL